MPNKPRYRYDHKTKTWIRQVLCTNGILNPNTGEYNTFYMPEGHMLIGSFTCRMWY